jgi:hypothetical protein
VAALLDRTDDDQLWNDVMADVSWAPTQLDDIEL